MSPFVSAAVSPFALLRVPRKTWLLAVIYLILCSLLLGGIRSLILSYQGDFRSLLMAYIFPESWHFAAGLLIDHFLEVQQRTVIINAVISASLVIVTITLFPLKELVSSSFEKHGKLVDQDIEELPLWEQGWQEVKLFLLFLACQGTIFWIGYQPDPVWKKTALILSYVFIFFAFAIDFLAPVFQRHQGRYSQIIKTLVRHLPASLLFGAIFSLPPIIVGRLWDANPTWSWNLALGVLFGVNVVVITWAVLAGTWLSSRMMGTFSRMGRSWIGTRLVAWVVVLGLIAGNAYAFGGVGLAIHHKSQILKCKYKVDFSSFEVDAPSVLGLLADKVEVGVSFDVVIENPTVFDVTIESNRLVVAHGGEQVAQTTLSPMKIGAGRTMATEVSLRLALAPSALKKGLDLFSREMWAITLYLEVAPGFEFPVYLITPPDGAVEP